jgi:hypothetical protein
MEQQEKQSGLILKYAKRRFDGGFEMEQIHRIERQQAIAQMQRMAQSGAEQSAFELPTAQVAVETAQAASSTPQANRAAIASVQPKTLFSKFYETCLIGPLAICIGVVGILTSCLAIFTFQRVKNEAMVEQARIVLKDCFVAIRKGAIETLTTPVRLFRLATGKA